jgi:glutamate synthase (NADPH) large chain
MSKPIHINAGGFSGDAGLYRSAYEHDNCGVGFLARLDGVASHNVVDNAVRILINLEHRGAVGGDLATGDGAGLLFQIPDAFFRLECHDLGFVLPDAGDYAVGMIFLPRQQALRNQCMRICENRAQEENCRVLGWRRVPVQNKHLGELAKSTEPLCYQLFVARGAVDKNDFERKLYVIRRLIEKSITDLKDDCSQFYVCSLSTMKIVYKGLLTGTQVPGYYPDIRNKHFSSAYALVHQRYSTNTWPTWPLAQPFRFLAHNGEINTLGGNINRMKAREPILESDFFAEDIEKIKPVLIEGASDSSILDNMLELLVLAGRSLPHSMMMLIPEAYSSKIQMSADKRAFYEFHSALMEPWDGPAAITFTDGRYISGTLDRNGLRPARYTITREGIIVLASETGVLDFPADSILKHGRLQPGKMFLVDMIQHRVVPDHEIKAKIARRRPYRRWIKNNRIELRGLFTPAQNPPEEKRRLLQLQHAFGYTREELKMILGPMTSKGQEAIGSMGNDAALAVLSQRPRLLFDYFKQLFAQVTNPPIDPLREDLVMSLESFVGREHNLLQEEPGQYRGLKLPHPILTLADLVRLRQTQHEDILSQDIPILFPKNGSGKALEKALQTIFKSAETALDAGKTLLILTDQGMDADHVSIPVLLVVSGLHHYLTHVGKRNYAGIIAETGEAREVIHFALLSAFGVDAVCPYLAFQTIRQMVENGMLPKLSSPEVAMDSYITAIKKGLLKTLSRMGISTLHGFFASQIFEAVGLNQHLINTYFCGTASRISGIGLDEIAQETSQRHQKGFPHSGDPDPLLDVGGDYHIRLSGEQHMWTTEAIYTLQSATRNSDYKQFKTYTSIIDSSPYTTLRSLLTFKKTKAIDIKKVEPIEAITPQFVTAAMSFGSISKEAHESIAIALNRLGGRSNSGEGGEDPQRYISLPNGDSKRSRIKQIASGRFGVTTQYAINADELQIKVAQGAKPGEGGQLPGHKVSVEIARVRHTTPGVTLISPPPHHDIYSIEDLAQLIYDLKTVNPDAKVSVKLVSEVGVGTIAAGVAKADADLILISGHDGGTGASPLTAIKHAGLPWELGLAEAQQVLMANQLRDRVVLQTDGQLKTGRDLAIAALLGAEEFGFGTSILITLGCVMMRKCHLNTCPVGVATQDSGLRSRFTGKPEYIESYLRFIAQELREMMAQLGFTCLDDMIGRTDLIDFTPPRDHYKAKTLDFSCLLEQVAKHNNQPRHSVPRQASNHKDCLDHELIRRAQPTFENRQSVSISLPIRNIHRTVGAMLSGQLVKQFGTHGLPENTIKISFSGSAGQSFGAFLTQGVHMTLKGDTNDYLGKSMAGGTIVVVPPDKSTFAPHDNIIVGNVVLYGATGGELYINGIAGERFAVRNSGAKAVVEGVSDHGCEYMTGGMVVILGYTGHNFAAGMSGGIAYVFDENEFFDTKCNLDMVDLESVWHPQDRQNLRRMIENHYEYTNSPRARMILENWEGYLPLFVKVMPIDYRKSLERMRMEEHSDQETVSATEEVYNS